MARRAPDNIPLNQGHPVEPTCKEDSNDANEDTRPVCCHPRRRLRCVVGCGGGLEPALQEGRRAGLHVLRHDEHPGYVHRELAGLGNEDLNIHLSVSGFALYQCQNAGGNTAPGQNKVLAGPASPTPPFRQTRSRTGT